MFADLLRSNAEAAARDAAIQHALAGVGEHIFGYVPGPSRRS